MSEAVKALDLYERECPACGAAAGMPCDKAVTGWWHAFPLPEPWSWWAGGPVYVSVHEARLP